MYYIRIAIAENWTVRWTDLGLTFDHAGSGEIIQEDRRKHESEYAVEASMDNSLVSLFSHLSLTFCTYFYFVSKRLPASLNRTFFVPHNQVEIFFHYFLTSFSCLC